MDIYIRQAEIFNEGEQFTGSVLIPKGKLPVFSERTKARTLPFQQKLLMPPENGFCPESLMTRFISEIRDFPKKPISIQKPKLPLPGE
jgi:hypothetical protein